MNVQQTNEQSPQLIDEQDALVIPSEFVALEKEWNWKRLTSWQPLPFLYQWFLANTFSPTWLPEKLRHPSIGSAVAVLLQIVTIFATLMLIHIFPGYAFVDLLEVLAIALVALTWGAGPSLVATFVGLVLLNIAIVPSMINVNNIGNVIGQLIFLLVGLAITIVASQIGRARQNAEDLAASLEIERTRLNAIIETVPDTVAIYDTQGNVVRINRNGREQAGPERSTANIAELPHIYDLRTASGLPFSPDDYPATHALRGETISGIEMHYTNIHGQERSILVSAAPLYDLQGQIEGTVSITHDISELRQSERRTQETLNALLEMAEALVLEPDIKPTTGELLPKTASRVAKRIAELTRSVLGCQRVSITAIEPETEIMYPVAVVGLPPEQEPQWWAEQPQNTRFGDSPMPDLVARLRANEVLILDMTQPPFDAAPNPYNIHILLTAPMSIDNTLVGLLALDYGGDAHEYTDDEIALAKAVAKLGALVIERERLLRERAGTHANELALREANRRMDEFLGMTSHELKTPLTSIKGNTQLAVRQLKSSLQGIQQMQSMMESTEQQIKLLDRLVNDLLDISSTQASQLALSEEQCDLVALVREVYRMQQHIHSARTITLNIASDTPILVHADAARITQVATNYLTNALKYSPDNTPIEMNLRQEEASAYFAVRDEGPGLNSEEQQQIWERFHRVHGTEINSSSFGSSAGLGLGLFISKMIIEQHRGHVGVESSPNEGALFWFTLPLA